jgi:hypothetical protein
LQPARAGPRARGHAELRGGRAPRALGGPRAGAHRARGAGERAGGHTADCAVCRIAFASISSITIITITIITIITINTLITIIIVITSIINNTVISVRRFAIRFISSNNAAVIFAVRILCCTYNTNIINIIIIIIIHTVNTNTRNHRSEGRGFTKADHTSATIIANIDILIIINIISSS